MRRRTLTAAILIATLYLQPATVAATVYSGNQYNARLSPPGFSPPDTAACSKSGVVDPASNYTEAFETNWIAIGNCTGSAHTVGSGYLGVSVEGFRDGNYCGDSGFYYSTSAAWGWQLWDQMCSIPYIGTHYYYTYPTNAFLECCGYDWLDYGGPVSPHNYWTR